MSAKAKEYEVFHEQRRCAHAGCQNLITHYAAPKGKRWAAVWCREHASDARNQKDSPE